MNLLSHLSLLVKTYKLPQMKSLKHHRNPILIYSSDEGLVIAYNKSNFLHYYRINQAINHNKHQIQHN